MVFFYSCDELAKEKIETKETRAELWYLIRLDILKLELIAGNPLYKYKDGDQSEALYSIRENCMWICDYPVYFSKQDISTPLIYKGK